MVQYGKISGTSDKSKGYTFYEYITGVDSGKTYGIDVGLRCDETHSIKYELDMQYEAAQKRRLMGPNSGGSSYFGISASDTLERLGSGASIVPTDRHLYMASFTSDNKIRMAVDGVSTFSSNLTSNQTHYGRAMIFAIGSNAKNANGVFPDAQLTTAYDSAYKIKLYRAKMYENDVLVRDLVPASNGTTYGLYDMLNGVFYTNMGTGAFAVSSNKSETDGLFDIQNVKVFKEGSVKTWNGEGGTWNSYQYQTSWVGVSVTNLDVFSEVTSLRQCSYNNYTGFHRNLSTTDSTKVQFWIDARRIYICYNPTSVNMPTGWKNEDGTPNVANIKTIVTGWLKEKPFMYLLDKEGVNYTSKEKLFEDYFVEVDRIVKYGKYNVFDPFGREAANCLDFRVSGTGPTAVFNEPDYSKIYWTFASNGHHGYGSTTDFEAHNHYRDDSWYFYMKDGKLYEGNNSTGTNWYWPAFPLKLEKGKTYTFSTKCKFLKGGNSNGTCDVVAVSYNSNGVWDSQMTPNAMTKNGDVISATFTVPDTFAWGLAFIRCAYVGNEVEFSEIQICEGTEVKPYEKAKNLLWENHLLMTDESEYTYITFDDESTIKLK